MFEDIKDYLRKMPPNALSTLPPGELDKYLFQVKENLSEYHLREITPFFIVRNI
ncbi:hypothetical protein WAZ07_22615 [Bacillus sp. FJAT-51639]|uniref:Uncharacterized protein n=1 Tax=Bacillus bruguierae TaxID=3127667 RepID=A0ABU8FPV4_9BACI